MKKLLTTLTASAIALSAQAGTTKSKPESCPAPATQSKTAEAAKATGKDATNAVKGTAKNAASGSASKAKRQAIRDPD